MKTGFETFTRSVEDINTVFAPTGSTSISWSIEGFWTHDTIRVYVERNAHGKWEMRLSVASGGQEDDTSAYVAAKNMAEALEDAANVIEQLTFRGRELEENYLEATAAYLEKEFGIVSPAQLT